MAVGRRLSCSGCLVNILHTYMILGGVAINNDTKSVLKAIYD